MEGKSTILRQRMIEQMRIRGMAEKTQAAHIRTEKDFALLLKRPPDAATPEELHTCHPKALCLRGRGNLRWLAWAGIPFPGHPAGLSVTSGG